MGHARFQAITHAYEVLKGRHSYDPAMEELERRRRSMARRATTVRPRTDYPGYRAPDVDWNASADDSWKDWIIIAMGVLVRDIWFH